MRVCRLGLDVMSMLLHAEWPYLHFNMCDWLPQNRRQTAPASSPLQVWQHPEPCRNDGNLESSPGASPTLSKLFEMLMVGCEAHDILQQETFFFDGLIGTIASLGAAVSCEASN